MGEPTVRSCPPCDWSWPKTATCCAPSPAAAGGRIIADTGYNDRGLAAKTSRFYNSSSPSGTLTGFADTDVAQQSRVTYDQLNRPTTAAAWANNSLKWQTTTTYGGNTVTVVPPDGGASVSTTDVFDRVTAASQYPTSVVTGTPETTSYSYDWSDNLTKITDPAGNQTSYVYDLLGRRTSTTDPDGGTASTGYNAADDVTATTDARGQKISIEYDVLDRPITRWAGDVSTGTKLASYTYDTLAKGELTSTSRYVGSDTYTVAVNGYTDNYQPTGQTITIPMIEGLLAGSYQTSYAYNPIGQPASITYPAAGGLAAETVNTGYDTLGDPTTLSGSTSYVTSTSYTAFGQLAQRVYGTPSASQLTRNYTWDPTTGRLATLAAQLPNAAQPANPTVLQNDTYSYAPTGDVTRIADGTDGQSQCYRYDGQHRLTDAWTATDPCAANPSTRAMLETCGWAWEGVPSRGVRVKESSRPARQRGSGRYAHAYRSHRERVGASGP